MPILSSFGAAAARAWKSASGAFAAFADNFNRTTSGSLGTSSSGGLWNALKGIWFADGTAAKSTDAATTYPVANVEMTKPDITASVSTGAGAGITISSTGTVQSVAAGGTAGFYTAQIINLTTTTGFAVGQWISATNGTGALYGGVPDYVEITSIDSSTSLSYRIKGGTTPVAGTVTNVTTRNADGGSGIALWITDSGNWWGVSYGRSIDTACNCSQCLTSYCSGGYANYASSYCGGYSTYYTSACASYSSSTSYSCSSTSFGFANQCSAYSTTYSSAVLMTYGAPYYCAVYSSGFCVAYVAASYNNGTFYSSSSSCSTYNNVPTYYCGGYTSSLNYTCASSSYYAGPACSSAYTVYAPACTGTTYAYSICNCQTCYPPYIRVFQSASSVVSEITRWTLASMAGAFKVITNSATKIITIRPYKETSMTTQIGSDLTYNATTATMANKFGIVLSPSDQIQGTQLDDFNITSN